MLTKDRMPFSADQVPWPGVGHLAKHGKGFKCCLSAMVYVAFRAAKAAAWPSSASM